MTRAEEDRVVANKVARAELMKRILIVVTAFIVTLTLIGVVVVLNAVRDTQQEGSPTLKAITEQQDDIETAANASTELLELILECLEPTSECAKETAAKDAEQQGEYIAAVIAAAYCVHQKLPEPYDIEELTACVGRLLESKKAQP